jgi:hypothetical protein
MGTLSDFRTTLIIEKSRQIIATINLTGRSYHERLWPSSASNSFRDVGYTNSNILQISSLSLGERQDGTSKEAMIGHVHSLSNPLFTDNRIIRRNILSYRPSL